MKKRDKAHQYERTYGTRYHILRSRQHAVRGYYSSRRSAHLAVCVTRDVYIPSVVQEMCGGHTTCRCMRSILWTLWRQFCWYCVLFTQQIVVYQVHVYNCCSRLGVPKKKEKRRQKSTKALKITKRPKKPSPKDKRPARESEVRAVQKSCDAEEYESPKNHQTA